MMLTRIGIRASTRSFFRCNSTSTAARDLNWVEYLNLKKRSNRLNMVASIFTAAGGAMSTLAYFGNMEIDPEKQIFGFDPFMVIGGTVFVGGLFGYSLGPFLGRPVFNVMNRSILDKFQAKDAAFMHRIRRNRVDPSSQSLSNAVPDYYGEKIYSLKDYRQWLRDCNAFRRKSREFL